METALRTPQAAIPFALTGLSAGWLSAGVFSNPMLGVTHQGTRLWAAGLAAVICGLMGAALTRWARRPGELSLPAALWWRLGPATIASGILTGAMTAVFTVGARGLPEGVGLGLVAGLGFLPVCRLVLGAARSAGRARLGSIVAASDRRAVWVFTLAALGASTAIAAIDWPPASMGLIGPPYVAFAGAMGAGLAVAAIAAFDWRALRRVQEVAHRIEPDAEKRTGDLIEDAPKVDYGLGEEVRAQVEAGTGTYRTRARTVALLIGSAEEASAALRRALRRNAIAFAMVLSALALHALATSRATSIAFHESRCRDGSSWDCRKAAEQWEQSGDPDDQRRGKLLRESACRRLGGAICPTLSGRAADSSR
jgi:hypothetical protein